MQIIYDEKSLVFKIDTKNSSYMIGRVTPFETRGHVALAGTLWRMPECLFHR